MIRLLSDTKLLKISPKTSNLVKDIAHVSQKTQLDWKLISSMAFVESSFKKRAKSKMGAKGLLQVMPVVYKRHKDKNPYNAKDNLSMGIAHYLKYYRLIEADSSMDRALLALAIYNSGIGHFRDAQRLAIRLKSNPYTWEGLKPAYLLLKNPRHYNKPYVRYGYTNGDEVTGYVAKISKHFHHLQLLEKQSFLN